MILITGASGLLGANLTCTAVADNQKVVAIYHRHKIQGGGFRSLAVDLTNREKVEDCIRTWRPTWIVHCAALTNVDWCENHPAETYCLNREATVFLANVAQQVGAGMVYISTDSVFNGQTGDYTETSPPDPINRYAQSKLAGEQAVQNSLENYLIIRTNFYGWNAQPKNSLAEWILSRLQANQEVPGFADVIFTPILVNHLSAVILAMLKKNLTGIYHVAGAEACSKYEFALSLARTFNLDAQVRSASIAESRLEAPRPRDTRLRTDKLSRALGQPLPVLVDGLEKFKTLRESGFVSHLKTLTGR